MVFGIHRRVVRTGAVMIAGLIAAVFVGGCSSPKGITTAEKRSFVRDMRDQTLEQLFKTKPSVETLIEQSPGYAVFSDVKANLFYVGAGSGYGILVESMSGRETYMRMAQLGGGLGLGIRDIRVVFVFKTDEALQNFLKSGWEFNATIDVAAKSGPKGGALGATRSLGDVAVFPLTESGLVAQATLNGTKYWRYAELN